jgi:hypothetical protein
MSDQENSQYENTDSDADALAILAVVAILFFTAAFYLSH